MRFPFTPIVVSLFLSTFAGCLADESPGVIRGQAGPASTFQPSSEYSPPPPAPEPTTTDETGAISGRVVDDEIRPIEGARAALLEKPLEALTDADGRFTFSGLPVGSYRMLVTRAGFTDGGGQAEIHAGTVTDVTVTLQPVPIPDVPYHESIPKTAYIKVTWIWITSLGSLVGYGHQAYFCDPCKFPMPYGNDTKQVIVEADWTKSIGAPGINDEVFLQYFVNWNDASAGTVTWTGYIVPRGRAEFQATDLATMQKYNAIRLVVNGGLKGINYEHKPEIWTTFAYGEKLPKEFTALPPP